MFREVPFCIILESEGRRTFVNGSLGSWIVLIFIGQIMLRLDVDVFTEFCV